MILTSGFEHGDSPRSAERCGAATEPDAQAGSSLVPCISDAVRGPTDRREVPSEVLATRVPRLADAGVCRARSNRSGYSWGGLGRGRLSERSLEAATLCARMGSKTRSPKTRGERRPSARGSLGTNAERHVRSDGRGHRSLGHAWISPSASLRINCRMACPAIGSGDWPATWQFTRPCQLNRSQASLSSRNRSGDPHHADRGPHHHHRAR